MELPFFSIIIPTYNRETQITTAIDSVLQQRFRGFEVIIVDDGSKDNTAGVIKKYLTETQVFYFRQDNLGVSGARNTGTRNAQGVFYLFLDSDDWLSEHYLEKCYEVLRNHDYKLLLGVAKFYTSDGKLASEILPEVYGDFFTHGLAGSFVISAPLYNRIGGYDENLTYSENSDLFLRLFDGKTIRKEEIVVLKDVNVCIHQEDRNTRRTRHAMGRYQNATYFLDKHKEFFESSLKDYVNFKKIQAVGALQQGMTKEARKCLAELLKRKVWSPKTILMYLFVLLLPSQAVKHYT